MANKSREQQQASVQKIIELTLTKGRLTVKEACAELHMCRDSVGKHFSHMILTEY